MFLRSSFRLSLEEMKQERSEWLEAGCYSVFPYSVLRTVGTLDCPRIVRSTYSVQALPMDDARFIYTLCME